MSLLLQSDKETANILPCDFCFQLFSENLHKLSDVLMYYVTISDFPHKHNL